MHIKIKNYAPDADVIVVSILGVDIEVAREWGTVRVYVKEPKRTTVLTLGSSEPAAIIGKTAIELAWEKLMAAKGEAQTIQAMVLFDRAREVMDADINGMGPDSPEGIAAKRIRAMWKTKLNTWLSKSCHK